MNKIWLLVVTLAIFLTLSFLFYQSMKGYVKETFGKKWLMVWGNKVYFWQSLIFMSTAGTALIMYILISFDIVIL